MLGATLMITQSFLYNAIFFTYSLVLTKFYDVAHDRAVLPHRLRGRQPGRPADLGRLFDTIGRKHMIAGTYIVSGICSPSAPPVQRRAR